MKFSTGNTREAKRFKVKGVGYKFIDYLWTNKRAPMDSVLKRAQKTRENQGEWGHLGIFMRTPSMQQNGDGVEICA